MRRQRKKGLPHAYFTSGSALPTPLTSIWYMNKFLNIPKLLDVKYCFLPHGMTVKQFAKENHLTDKKFINLKGVLRPMAKKDVSQVFKLWNLK